MASSTHFISLLFIVTLFFSLQIHARESHFFSKVAPVNHNNNAKEAELPDIEPEASATVTKHERKPTFIPETQNSYGLYGQESAQLPPSTTFPTENAYEANHDSYLNNKDSYYANRHDLKNEHLSGTGFSSNNNDNNYFNKDAYEANLQDRSNTKLADKGYNTISKQNNNKYYYNNAANQFDMEREGMHGTSYEANLNDPSDTRLTETSYNSMSNQKTRYHNDNHAANKFIMERQGMSDTRFLEGGRYYYDINSEKHNPTMYRNSRQVDTRNGYSSNSKGYYANNQYMYDNDMSMNQNQDEFEDDHNEFQP